VSTAWGGSVLFSARFLSRLPPPSLPPQGRSDIWAIWVGLLRGRGWNAPPILSHCNPPKRGSGADGFVSPFVHETHGDRGLRLLVCSRAASSAVKAQPPPSSSIGWLGPDGIYPPPSAKHISPGDDELHVAPPRFLLPLPHGEDVADWMWHLPKGTAPTHRSLKGSGAHPHPPRANPQLPPVAKPFALYIYTTLILFTMDVEWRVSGGQRHDRANLGTHLTWKNDHTIAFYGHRLLRVPNLKLTPLNKKRSALLPSTVSINRAPPPGGQHNVPVTELPWGQNLIPII